MKMFSRCKYWLNSGSFIGLACTQQSGNTVRMFQISYMCKYMRSFIQGDLLSRHVMMFISFFGPKLCFVCVILYIFPLPFLYQSQHSHAIIFVKLLCHIEGGGGGAFSSFFYRQQLSNQESLQCHFLSSVVRSIEVCAITLDLPYICIIMLLRRLMVSFYLSQRLLIQAIPVVILCLWRIKAILLTVETIVSKRSNP